MSSVTTYCRVCGRPSGPEWNGVCPQCGAPAAESAQPLPQYPQYQAVTPQWKPSYADLFWAFVVWGVSGGFGVMLDMAIRFSYWRTNGKPIELQLTTPLVIATTASSCGSTIMY